MITQGGFGVRTYEADVIVQDASGRRMQMERAFLVGVSNLGNHCPSAI